MHNRRYAKDIPFHPTDPRQNFFPSPVPIQFERLALRGMQAASDGHQEGTIERLPDRFIQA